MAGIYLHIPFCRQACHYCDFHFSTYHKLIPPVIEAINRELVMQKDYLNGDALESIYFGGGTPSLLDTGTLNEMLNRIHKYYPVMESCEITLEANPDDLQKNKVRELRKLGINRLSIGTQSFQEEFLAYLNRVHSASDIRTSYYLAREYGFDNINMDLIYAIRNDTADFLKRDLEEILKMNPEHISAYCLTIEPATVFGRWVEKNKITPVPDTEAAAQFELVAENLTANLYDHYEISNYAREGFISRHNSNYWREKPYLGTGPSAHSFNLRQRQHNIANNALYVKSMISGKIPCTIDYLSVPDRINERILTGLRTKWGCDLDRIRKEFGTDILAKNRDYIRELAASKMIEMMDGVLRLSRKGMLFADRIASDLFVTREQPE